MAETDLKRGLKEARQNLKSGRVREALARLFHLTEKYPENGEVKEEIAVALVARGIESASRGKIDQARDDFQRSIGYRETPEGHIALGRIHQTKGEFDDAFQEFTKALDLNESMPSAHENLGFYFLETQEFDQAIKAFGHAISRGAAGRDVYIGLWKAHAALERFDRAHEAIRDGLALHPKDDVLLTVAGTSAYLRKDFAGAEEYWLHAVRGNPSNIEAAFNLAGLAAVQGDRATALDWLKKCAAIDARATRHLWKADAASPRARFTAFLGDEDFLDVFGS